MARNKQKTWQVYFDLNVPRKDQPRRRRPGKEYPVHQVFFWGGAEWRIPAVYACAQGLVADFVRRVPVRRIREFADRHGLRPDEDRYDFTREKRMRLESENPLTFDFSPTLLLNGRPLHSSDGRGTCWNPLPGCHAPDDLPLLEHYGLDPSDGWFIWRYNFPWKTKHKPPIRSLAVYMEAARVSLPGPHITVQGEGGSFPFTDPDGTAHTLTVREYARETLPRGTFRDKDFLYPDHCVTLGYTVEPPLPRSAFHLMDCSEGDRPRRVHRPAPWEPEQALSAAVCVLNTEPDVLEKAQIGVIGSADGPAAVFVASPQNAAKPQVCHDVSSLYFETPETLEWLMVFQKVPCGPIKIKLL